MNKLSILLVFLLGISTLTAQDNRDPNRCWTAQARLQVIPLDSTNQAVGISALLTFPDGRAIILDWGQPQWSKQQRNTLTANVKLECGQVGTMAIRTVEHTYMVGRPPAANTDPNLPGPLPPGSYQFVLTMNGEFAGSTAFTLPGDPQEPGDSKYDATLKFQLLDGQASILATLFLPDPGHTVSWGELLGMNSNPQGYYASVEVIPPPEGTVWPQVLQEVRHEYRLDNLPGAYQFTLFEGNLKLAALEFRIPESKPLYHATVKPLPLGENGETNLLATLHMNTSGYTVKWGDPVRDNQGFTAAVEITPPAGVVLPVVTEVSHEYHLGVLEGGLHTFTLLSANRKLASAIFWAPGVKEPTFNATFRADPVTSPEAKARGRLTIPLLREPYVHPDPTTFGDDDLLVVSADGRMLKAVFQSYVVQESFPEIYVLEYAIEPPGELWSNADQGYYRVSVVDKSIAFAGGDWFVASGVVGGFQVKWGDSPNDQPVSGASIEARVDGPTISLTAKVETNPGWSIAEWGEVVGVNGCNDQWTSAVGSMKTSCLRIEAKATQEATPAPVRNGHTYLVENLAAGAYHVTFLVNGRIHAETRFVVSGTEPPPPPLVFAVTAKTEPITQAGTEPHPLTVHFAPMSGMRAMIDAASLDDSDLILTDTRANRMLKARFDGIVSAVDSLVPAEGISQVRYLVDAPPNGWSATEQGEYVIELVDGAITYNQGVGLPGRKIGHLAVKIQPSGPPASQDFPIVVVEARNVILGEPSKETADALSAYEFRLLAIDQSGVEVASVKAATLTVTQRPTTLPKERLEEARNDPATGVVYTLNPISVTPLDAEATVVVAVYGIVPPLDAWTGQDNGFYVIHLPAGTIKDTDGHAHPGGPLGGFTVMVYPPANGAREAGNGWYNSEKLGYFHAESFPWFLHPEHGWWYAAQSYRNNAAATSSDWYWDNQLEWLWVEQQFYPWLYSEQNKDWLFYFEGSNRPRWFYRAGAREFLEAGTSE